MSSVLASAGALGYVIIGLGAFGLVALLALASLAVTRRRVPLAALLVIPYAVLAVGAISATIALGANLEAASAVAADHKASAALEGAWRAMEVDWLARWVAAILLVAGAWVAAAGAVVVPSAEAKLTPIAAGAALALTVVGAITLAFLGVTQGVGSGVWAWLAILVLGGLAVTVAAARRATDDEMWRVAGMRFAASMSLVFAAFHASRALDIGTRITAFSGPLVAETDVTKAIEMYHHQVQPVILFATVGFVIAVLVALCGFFGEIVQVVVRPTVFDAFAVAALMIGVGALRAVEGTTFSSIVGFASSEPAVEMYLDLRNDLAAATVTDGDEVVAVRFVDSGFGDVLTLEQDKWIRLWRWNGARWIETDREPVTPELKLSDAPPLLAIRRDTPSSRIVPILERTGSAFLLLRASEAKAGVHVPAELQRLQVTLLPIGLSKDRDLKTQLWQVAGAREANWGPTLWYGENDDAKDAVAYAAAATTATASPGIQLLVENRKVSDIITTCMPWVVARGEAVAGPDGEEIEPLAYDEARWCAVTADSYDTVRTEAAAVWDLPEPTNLKATIAIEGPLQQAQVEDRVRRELGGIGWCAEKAVAAGEEGIKGRMTLYLAMSREGQVYDTLVDEKSKVQSPTILRCASRRFRGIQFAVPVPEVEVAPTEPVDPKAPVPPPPVPPRGIVHLDF